jgi:gas vesicle protein
MLGAFVCGALAGAVVAILLAPARGRETRERVRAMAREGQARLSKQTYVEDLQAQLARWSATIDAMGRAASQTTADARREYNARVADLRSRVDQGRRTLDDLRAAGEEAWHDLKAGADRAWQDLRRAVEEASSRFA